jgi:hypothetical protein
MFLFGIAYSRSATAVEVVLRWLSSEGLRVLPAFGSLSVLHLAHPPVLLIFVQKGVRHVLISGDFCE